ncbi:P-type conjugative transfer protein TrbJ, partial [uncultured Vibrio sp.]
MRALIPRLILPIGLIWSCSSYAFFCANCATITQMATSNLQQSKSYYEQIQQTINSLRNLEYQVQNLQRSKNLHWGDLKSHTNNLNTIASRGKSVSYAMGDVSERMGALFAGVDGYEEQSVANMNSVETYRAQGDALRDTAQSSLELAHQMSEYQTFDASTLDNIQANAANAQGAMQIAQAQSELLAQIVQQLHKLQTLMQTQIQMNATYIA